MDTGSDIVVAFEGHEGSLTLTFREEPKAPAGVRCDQVCITLGRLGAEVRTLMAADPRRLRDEVRSVLESASASGAVTFGSVENDLHVRVELDRGKGAVIVKVETDFGDRDGAADFRLTTDQAALQNTVRQLDALLRAFPRL